MSTQETPSRNRQPRALARHSPACPADLRVSRLGYALAALVAVVGMATAMVWGITGILDQVQQPEAFVRAEIPGSVTVALTEVGPHVIYYEGADASAVSAERFEVHDARDTAVAVRPYRQDLRYDAPGKPGTLGTAIGVFDAERTGAFVIGTLAAVPDAHAQLAVGDDLAPATVRAVLLPALAALLSVDAALALAFATWARGAGRSRS